jgi:serine/threonine protein kinase
MNLVTGRTLRHEVEESPDGRLTEDRIRTVISELVSALAAAHRQGVSHLDIKPENIMVNEVDGRTVLVDFGSARVDLGVETVDPTTQPFTYAYAAPEVIFRREGRPGPYSDIFELGMLLHELRCGKLPPPVMDRIVPSRIEELDCQELGEPWAQMVTAATRFSIARRPQDVAAWWNYDAQVREHQVQHRHDEKYLGYQREIERIEISRQQTEAEKLQLESRLLQTERKSQTAQLELANERNGLAAEVGRLRKSLDSARQNAETARQELAQLKNSLPELFAAIIMLVSRRVRKGLEWTYTFAKNLHRSYQVVKAEQINSPYNTVTISLGENPLVISKAMLFRVAELSPLGSILLLPFLGWGILVVIAELGLVSAFFLALYFLFWRP